MKNPIGVNFQKLSIDINNLTTIQDVIACWVFEDFKSLYQQDMSYEHYIMHLSSDYDHSPTNFSRLLTQKKIDNEIWYMSSVVISVYGHGVIVDIDEEHLLELKMTYL